MKKTVEKKADDKKAKAYKTLLYQLTGLAFDANTQLKKSVRRRMKACAAYRYFTKDKVDEYMTARPERLMVLHKEMVRDLGDANGVLLGRKISIRFGVCESCVQL